MNSSANKQRISSRLPAVNPLSCLIGAMFLTVAAHAAQPSGSAPSAHYSATVSQAAALPSSSAPVGITAPKAASCKSLLQWLMAGDNYLAPFWPEKSAYWMMHC